MTERRAARRMRRLGPLSLAVASVATFLVTWAILMQQVLTTADPTAGRLARLQEQRPGAGTGAPHSAPSGGHTTTAVLMRSEDRGETDE